MKFKNSNNVYLIRELFYETASDKTQAAFTLSDEDIKDIPSLGRLYLEAGDPTEYTFATTVLGGWEHWEKLSRSALLRDHVTKWRKELETKLRSEAVARIILASEAGGRDGLQASKYVAERGWEKTPSRAGRPRKADIATEAARIAQDKRTESEDFDRLIIN